MALLLIILIRFNTSTRRQNDDEILTRRSAQAQREEFVLACDSRKRLRRHEVHGGGEWRF